MRIALASDARTPQIYGAVTTLKPTGATLSPLGHEVRIIRPQERLCLPFPRFPQIRRLALWPGSGPTTIWPTCRARS
jgi:hypothetical protein